MPANTAFVGLGSNLDQPRRQVEGALEGLNNLPSTQLARTSSLYRTAPWGNTSQPEFVNAVAQIETGLSPRDLLEAMLSLEQDAGRIRSGEQWGPRVLDLDLLLYGDEVQDDPQLTLPHPCMHQRAFVLVPLLEIAPHVDIPRLGAAADWLESLDASDVRSVEPSL